MEVRENKCHISQELWWYGWNSKHFMCKMWFCEILHLFSRAPIIIFFGITKDNLLHLYPLKNVRKNAICFKLLWYKIFVHWKSKLLNALVDSVLNCSRRTFCEKYSTGGPWGGCRAKRHMERKKYKFLGFSPNVQCPSKSLIVAWTINVDLLCVTTPFSAITFGWLNWPMIDASDRKSFWFFSFEPG